MSTQFVQHQDFSLHNGSKVPVNDSYHEHDEYHLSHEDQSLLGPCSVYDELKEVIRISKLLSEAFNYYYVNFIFFWEIKIYILTFKTFNYIFCI